MSQTSSLRVAVIGGGKMGEAIMGGWIAASEAPADGLQATNFVVANPGQQRRDYLTQRYGVTCVADACSVEGANIVILAVKPQVMMGMLETIVNLPAYGGGVDGPLFVSIAGGLSTARLRAALPENARLVRVMPNTPLLVSAGATTIARDGEADEADTALVRDLFACLGEAFVVDETAMDATAAVSGSGPAYVAALIEALRDAGVHQGLDSVLAEKLALQTVYGTAQLMKQTGQSAETARIAVCSPGGSTLAALAAMEDAGFTRSLDIGVAAAVQRSKEQNAC